MKGVNRMAQSKVPVAQPDFEEEVIEFENAANEATNVKPVIPVKSFNNEPTNLKPASPVKSLNNSLENEEVATENSENKKRNTSDGSLRSETITVLPAPLSQRILSRLERQKNKYWHFKFVEEEDFIKLEIKLLEELGLTVQPNYGGKKRADLTLFEDGNTVGKIHFLHANRPDICDPTTFYVKLHFYEFEDRLFESVKNVMINYFHSLDKPTSSLRGGKKMLKKTRKQKRMARRKTRRS